MLEAAEREAAAIRAGADSDAGDRVKQSTAESRRNYESSLLLEIEKVKQEKEELIKAGRKEIYSEEEKAKSRMQAALVQLIRKAEEYFGAEAR